MPHKFMFVSDSNPNDATGGGGCVCDPQRQIDCKPPYVLFPGNDMESIASPHVVLCLECARTAVAQMEDESQHLAAGEKSNITVAVPYAPELPQPRLPDVDALLDDEEDFKPI